MKDSIYTSVPVNKVAYAVVQSGEHYEIPEPPETMNYSETPIRTVPFLGRKEHDLRGKVFNNVKVIGFYKDTCSGGKWVYRCRCGMYSTARSKTIKSGNAKCWGCSHLEKVKSGWYGKLNVAKKD